MKYCTLICDGMSDYKIKSLGDKTPMDIAEKPLMDKLAKKSLAGTASNVPQGMIPESDTANLAILSYDPMIYSKGRSPLEAASMGIEMSADETAFRCNLVTISENCGNYEDEIMIDHSSDEITTEEADALITSLYEALENNFFSTDTNNGSIRLYTGVSYRHCLIWKNAPEFNNFMRPHDILGKCIKEYLPPEPFFSMMKFSREILTDHPINKSRRERGLRPANSMWLWSPGKKPHLPSFYEKWNKRGAVISAVDLIRGIGKCAGMDVLRVEGATGNIHTNYEGKAKAAVEAFKDGAEFVFIHVEAPDECGHRAELENKILSIGYIDERLLRPLIEYLNNCGEAYRILILPDHPTPICTRTHAMDPVPFIIYDSNNPKEGIDCFCEDECTKTGLYLEHGYNLLNLLFSSGDL